MLTWYVLHSVVGRGSRGRLLKIREHSSLTSDWTIGLLRFRDVANVWSGILEKCPVGMFVFKIKTNASLLTGGIYLIWTVWDR